MINSFGVSIRELLALDIMKKAKVLSGLEGIDRRVTKMNVMEVPDILDWVTPGEFLLTTAYSIKDDIHQLDDLIPKLNQKKVAGIGIKTKRYIEEIPQSIIDRSNQYNFPIIEIPYDISFSEIIMPALTEIINKQTMTLTHMFEFHASLIDIIIHGGSLQEISDAIFNSVGNPVTISEKIFRTHFTAGEKGFEEKIEHVFVEEYSIYDFNMKTNIRVEDKIDGKRVGRLIIPIKVDDTVYGYINIWEMNQELTTMEITVITSSTSIITLDLLKKLSIYQIENKHRAEFFDNLFSNDSGIYRRAIESKTFYDFQGDLSYTVMILNMRQDQSLIKSYAVEKLSRHLDHLIASRSERMIYANKGDRIILLIGSQNGENDSLIAGHIMQLAKDIEETVWDFEKQKICDIGIGRDYRNAREIRNSYQEAMRVIDYLKKREDISILHHDDLGIYRILSYNELKPELEQFFKDVLEPLVRYDADKGQDLVETLKKYYEFRGNTKRVSDAMFTHYNTIVYRMNRIKEITNLDFEDPDDYLNMQIAIKIFETMNR